MNRSDSPKKQPKPFGVNGQRGVILPTTPAGDNSASYELGFPPITMILKSAGGLPPKGQDMNQILYELSALGRWSSSGALNTFDSEFASEISGYPSGAMLISNDGERIFINTTEGNLSDPNSNGAGWKDAFSYLGLGEAAKRNVGTGTNQIPDMSSFTSGNGWCRYPDGTIFQRGISVAGAIGSPTFINFPIAFTNYSTVQIVVSYDNAESSVNSIPSFAATPVSTGLGFSLMGSQPSGSNTTYCRWIAIGK
ncbi:gp53-like domain-containing protein [Escherichia coli]|uniref:gp53-like domain-containing protein n=1 Tax=Escherichia coli TaxID=562 RepID=UPI003EEA10DD